MKPNSPVDCIYHGDSRYMHQVPDGAVSLVVCSPPYNVRKPYSNHNDDMPVEDYEDLLLGVWRECKRVLRPGGRLCVNVAGVWRQPYLPLQSLIWKQLVGELGFQMRGEIIWNKAASVGVSTAWGSFASPSNPTLRDVHEYISVYSKDDFRLVNQTGAKPDISHDDFVKFTRSVWYMATDSPSKVGHPAPFPVALPRRLILLYTYPGDIVLDPFAGAGTTCVAACLTGRHYIGYDIDEGYVRIAQERVRQIAEQEVRLPLEMEEPVKRRAKMPKAKGAVTIAAAAVVGPGDVREREVSVTIRDGEVLLGIRTVGEPDIQKQHLAASLPPLEAQRLATALLNAAERLITDQ